MLETSSSVWVKHTVCSTKKRLSHGGERLSFPQKASWKSPMWTMAKVAATSMKSYGRSKSTKTKPKGTLSPVDGPQETNSF